MPDSTRIASLQRLNCTILKKPPSDGRGAPSAWFSRAPKPAPLALSGRDRVILLEMDAGIADVLARAERLELADLREEVAQIRSQMPALKKAPASAKKRKAIR